MDEPRLFEWYADVNVKGDMQWTPLHFASSHGHLEAVERKANVNAQVRDHGTPMHLAARRGHIEIVRMLLQNEADVHIQGMTAGRRSRPLMPLGIATLHSYCWIMAPRLIRRCGTYGITCPCRRPCTQGSVCRSLLQKQDLYHVNPSSGAAEYSF